MDITWVDVAQPIVGGLTAMLGVFVTESALRALRRSGLCPERWNQSRTALLARDESGN
jgi:hypothetical protein